MTDLGHGRDVQAPVIEDQRMMEPQVRPLEPPAFGLTGPKLGPYRLGPEIASGGMASVHIGCLEGSRGFERLVALKRIHPHLAREREFVEMFLDEARIAARISHPFVASVTDFGEFEGQPFITMELLLGEPISRVLAAVTNRPSELSAHHYRLVVTRLIADLCEGLHAAHEVRDEYGVVLNVIHRDISPTNLLVLYDGTPKVLDFGIARARNRLHHTVPGSFKGKLGYAAPEVLQAQPYDKRADIWSMGVVLWEMLTGARLFSGESELERLVSVTRGRITPPSEHQPTIPPELEKVTMTALARDPQHRYQTARAMARDLERLLGQWGDSVPHADVADWMTALFPGAAERKHQLLRQAFDIGAAGDVVDEVQQQHEVARVHTGVEPPGSGSPANVLLGSADTENLPIREQNRRLVADLRPAFTSVAVELDESSSVMLSPFRTNRHGRWVLLGLVGLVGAAALVFAGRSGRAPQVGSPADAPPSRVRPAYTRIPPAPLDKASSSGTVGGVEPRRELERPPAVAGEAPVKPVRKLVAAPSASQSEPAHPVTREGLRPVQAPVQAPAPSVPAARPPALVGKGQLLVRSADGPAEIFYNGRRLTATPALLTFPAGTHELHIRALGETEFIPVTVSVKAGETVVYDVRQVDGDH